MIGMERINGQPFTMQIAKMFIVDPPQDRQSVNPPQIDTNRYKLQMSIVNPPLSLHFDHAFGTVPNVKYGQAKIQSR